MKTLAIAINTKNKAEEFLNKHGRFLFFLMIYMILLFVVPHVFAGTTQGDLSTVDKHVHDEVVGDVLNILAWACLAMGCIAAVTKMNPWAVVSMIVIFFVLVWMPDVISTHFSALI